MGQGRHRGAPGLAVRRGGRCGPIGLQHPDRVGPRRGRKAGGHSGAAGNVGHPPSPGGEGPAHQHRSGGGNGLGPRSAPFRPAGRLRRRSRAPVPGDGNAGRDGIGPGRVGREGGVQLHQGDRQGPAEGDVQDGHLDLYVVHRRTDLRGDRPVARTGGQVLPRHGVERGRHRHLRGGRGSPAPAPRRVRRCAGAGQHAGSRRRIRLPHPRRRAHVDAGFDRQAAARHARQFVPDVQGIRQPDQRPEQAPHDAARPVRVQGGAGARHRTRRSGACQGDRQALRHRRDVARLDLDRGAHHAGRGDEPHRRQVEHRRRRRGRAPLPQRAARHSHQAGHQGVGRDRS